MRAGVFRHSTGIRNSPWTALSSSSSSSIGWRVFEDDGDQDQDQSVHGLNARRRLRGSSPLTLSRGFPARRGSAEFAAESKYFPPIVPNRVHSRFTCRTDAMQLRGMLRGSPWRGNIDVIPDTPSLHELAK